MSYRKLFQELEFKDAFMFAVMMEEPEICRRVLERFLGIPIKKVVVHSEHAIVINPDRRAIRLDVYADNEEGTIYNVEMQTTDKKNIPKRSRFHQSQMDVANLKPGMAFNDLPESIVIFICTFDPFGKQLYRYTFQEQCQENGEPLGDGTCKIIFNTKGTNKEDVPEELVRFLEYIDDPKNYSEDVQDDLLDRLEEQIEELKRDRKVEERYMLLEEMLNDEREEGRLEGRLEEREVLLQLIQCLLEDGLSSEISRLTTEPLFLKEMLEKYELE